MPNRIIRDACKTSPSLAALSDLAERTFWRVITVLDDFGRYHGTDLALLAAAYPVPPADLTPAKFGKALRELEAGDLLRFYEVGGRRYVHSPTWAKYQRLRARDSQFPEPPCSLGGGHRAVIAPPSAPGIGIGIGIGIGDGGGSDSTPQPPQPGGQPGEAEVQEPAPAARLSRPRVPEYVLSCRTCVELLRLVNDALASCYTAPGQTGEWLHRAHTVVPATHALEVVRREVERHASDRKRRRWLQPIVLFKPENWDTTVNRNEPHRQSLAEILGE